MKKFHDVEIYSGTRLATTGSRLEIGASNKFLREIFSGLADCARCREPVVLIFPDEEESTLREAFNRLSHFKSALSIIESKFPLHWSYLMLWIEFASSCLLSRSFQFCSSLFNIPPPVGQVWYILTKIAASHGYLLCGLSDIAASWSYFL